MRIKVITGLILLLPFFGFSQGEWNNWYFGFFAGLDFNSGNPVALTNSTMLAGNRVNMTVSDSIGNLLFYGNYSQVWNKNNVVMPNGSGLLGGMDASQPVLAVPKLDEDSVYYIFTIGDGLSGNPPYGMYYSILDLRLDGGLGDIVPSMKNIPIPLANDAYVYLTATRHRNNRDIWVVVVKNGIKDYYASFLITPSGINLTPVLSETKNLHNSTNNGDIRISPDGSKLVRCDTLAEMCNFNDNTGVVSTLFTFKSYFATPIFCRPYGAEFSSNNKYLYIAENVITFPDSVRGPLFQYDASISDSVLFRQSEYHVGDSSRYNLQIGPDGKIYVSPYEPPPNSKNYNLHVINNPSIHGAGCNYQYNAVNLAGKRSFGALPQFFQRYKAYLHSMGNCQNDSIHFSGDIWPPADSIRWNFGDPASGIANISTLANSSHNYSTPGTYTVELYVRHNDNRTDTSWRTITILSTPQPMLGADRTICLGTNVTFDAGACSGCTYLWKDVNSGVTVGTNQTLTTGLAGKYCVTVTNPGDCVGTDTVQLVTTAVPQVGNNPLSKTICSAEPTGIILLPSVPNTVFHWTATLTSGSVTGFSADSGVVINQTLVNPMSTAGVVTYHITPEIGSCSGIVVDFPVTVNPGDSVKVSIATTATTACAGTNLTFTATPYNPGSNPVYLWKVNNVTRGSNSPVLTYMPGNGDQVKCILTSSNTICTSNNPATSNGITINVNPNLAVSVSVSSSANPVCSGSLVTFSATPTNGGTSAQYQWKVNDLPVGTNSPNYTFTPLSGDVVTCTLTSNIACPQANPATSNPVTMTVNPNSPVSLTIAASNNPVCAGIPVTYSATPTNGGSLPAFQWKVNGLPAGTNSPNYTFTPLSGDVVTCTLTSNIACPQENPATSNTITMVISDGPLVSFSGCFDTITSINAKPIKLKGGIPLNGTYSGAGVNSATSVFTPSVAGAGTKIITYSYTNAALCTASKTRKIIVQPAPVFVCGNNLADIRDNKIYPSVQIGSQCWMAKNLDYGMAVLSSQVQNDNCISEKYCYNDLDGNCTNYGGLYQWDELMKYDDTQAGQGFCPPGWHVPTEDEWQTLFNFYKGDALAGEPLQDNLISGFNALSSGVSYLNSSMRFKGFATLFWSSTSSGQFKALSHGMNTYDYSVSLYTSSRANAFPVRCLRD